MTTDFSRRPAVVAQVETADRVKVAQELTRDDHVAAAIAPDVLRRPAVVAQVTPADKVRVVEELTRDETVAAEVTTGLLRRPDVAFRAMPDDTARHQVNHAQVERGWHAPRSAGPRRRNGTPTPSASSCSKPARPAWPSTNWSAPANCRPTRPAQAWPACATPSPNAAGRR